MTTVDVLTLTGLRRTRDDAVLARVRAPLLADEGFAFVRPAEFATDCPLIALAHDGGPVPHTAESLAPDPALQRRPRWPVRHVEDRRDYTGDGRPDDLVIVGDPDRPSEGDYMLRWREAGRVAFATVAMHDDRLRHVSWVQPLAASPTPLIVWRHDDIALTNTCTSAGAAGVELADSQDWFYRWHPSGRVVQVWRWEHNEHAESLRVDPTPDGHLVVVGERTGRRQRLLWDAARFTFVPEGTTFPTEENYTFHCNPSPRAPYEDRE